MSRRPDKKAVILWTKDDKVGVESINHVPENARFEGAVTSVKFTGNNKFYPARIMFISDDDDKLEEKTNEVALDILNKKKKKLAEDLGNKRRASNSTKTSNNSCVASERDIAVALGSKAPVPKHLEAGKKAAQKVSKDRKVNHAEGQNQLDSQVFATITKSLFPANVNSTSSENEEGAPDDVSVLDGKGDEVVDDDTEARDQSCSCDASTFLSKFDYPVYHNFFRSLVDFYENRRSSSESPRYLTLLPIEDDAKEVELTSGRGVMISLSVKDQLKVDYSNKPQALAKQTLFALYGKELFRHLTVTGRGNRPGTYGIPEDVLKAVVGFVNRHVNSDRALKVNGLVALINKRAPEWRKSPASPGNKKLESQPQKNNKSRVHQKVVSTSPFKCSPLKGKSQNVQHDVRCLSPPAQSVSPPQSPARERSVLPSSTPIHPVHSQSVAPKTPPRLGSVSGPMHGSHGPSSSGPTSGLFGQPSSAPFGQPSSGSFGPTSGSFGHPSFGPFGSPSSMDYQNWSVNWSSGQPWQRGWSQSNGYEENWNANMTEVSK